jgi:hypothetical protein
VSPVHLSVRAFSNYVRNYDVAGKIRSVKLQGRFDTITAIRRAPYHARLALHQII